MAQSILIIAESGAGKSTSIANLDPKETFIVNVANKPLPFKGWKNKYKIWSREDQTGKENILNSVDDCTSIWDINILRENLLGVEMPVYQAQEMGLLDERGLRIVPVDYSKGF